MDYVFTSRSLSAVLTHAPDDEWFRTMAIPATGEWDIFSIVRDGVTYVIHRANSDKDPRIVVLAQGENGKQTELLPTGPASYRPMLTRIAWLALAAESPPVHLPPGWSEFHAKGNRIAFFACQRDFGAFRWIAEISTEGSTDVCLWKLTSEREEIRLADYVRPVDRYRAAIAGWTTAFAEVRERFTHIPEPPETIALQPTVDLDAASFGAVTQYRMYTAWLDHLTAKQREFIQAPVNHSVKLRGPAGSGKTLALELKVLRELYRARDEGTSLRILFATHSWAVAEQVDAALRTMDERGDLAGIDIFPLLTIAQERLPTERSNSGLTLLGEDSLSGKQEQLRRISEVVEKIRRSDWLTMRNSVSPAFRAQVEASQHSAERNGLVWDLMMEFSSVLSAHGIMPGITAERKYLALPRTQWMMPLHGDTEKRFVLQVYTEYIGALKQDLLLTSDQLVNDYLNYLETFTWNLKRSTEGYDLVFVDELHLFNEQERLVLNYLTRNADEYPRIFMALDPRQSPYEIYADFPVARATQGESGTAEEQLGEVRNFELTTVHRFTPEILGLIQHINLSYPALDMGADWTLDLKSVGTSAKSGSKPHLMNHTTLEAERRGVLRSVDEAWHSAEKDERVAVVVLDPLTLPAYSAALKQGNAQFRVLESRDDYANLRFSKRTIVLSAAEYVGGLQFDRVIIAGLPDLRTGRANLGHQKRRFLSLLYLAISRASRYVEIHTNDEIGGVPEILEQAIKGDLMTSS
jgi:hypothetical protein